MTCLTLSSCPEEALLGVLLWDRLLLAGAPPPTPQRFLVLRPMPSAASATPVSCILFCMAGADVDVWEIGFQPGAGGADADFTAWGAKCLNVLLNTARTPPDRLAHFPMASLFPALPIY